MHLFMIEVRVSDLPRSLAWYRDVLALEIEMTDAAGGFALLSAGAARVALKAGGERGRDAVRLSFRADDLDSELARLLGLGVQIGEPIDNPSEGYREVRLADPDGTPISLFAWIG